METVNCLNCTHEINTLYLDAVVTNRVREIVINILFIGAGSFISLFGIIANTINIVVYVKHGIKDSATVQFLSLSASDYVFSVLAFMTTVSVFIGSVRPYLTLLDPVSFSYCLAIIREKAFTISVIITFMMSIERCYCVAFPFSVKRIFLKSRIVKAIICITVMFVVFLIPEYLTVGLVWTFDRAVNASRLIFWSSSEKYFTDVWKNIIISGVLPVVSSITATMCIVYMGTAVQASNILRKRGVTGQRRNSSLMKQDVTNGIKSSAEKTSNLKKDARLTRTVIAVATLFIVCNIPKLIVIASSIVVLFIPDFSLLVHGRYNNLISIILTITFDFEAVNSASTFLIYYASSTKFKTTVNRIVSICSMHR